MKTRQALSISILFMMGTSIISIGNYGYHAWQAMIVSFFLCIPFFFLIDYLMRSHPGKSLFEIICSSFFKPIAKIILMLYILYILYVSGRIVFRYVEFVTTIRLVDKAQVPLLLSIIAVSIVLLKSSVRTFARFGQVAFILSTISIISFIIIGLEDVNLSYLLPLYPYHEKDFIKNIFLFIIRPFGEGVILINVLCQTEDTKYKRHIFFMAMLFSFLILLLVTIRTISVLGDDFVLQINYPLYTSVGIINFMDFLVRIESLSVIIFFFAILIKLVICLYSIKIGIEQLFNIKETNVLSFPITFLNVALSQVLYQNITEFIQFYPIYAMVSVLFIHVIPIILCIITFIKQKKIKKKNIILSSS